MLKLKSGQNFIYEDYESMRAAWFQSCQTGNLDRVVILDVQQPESKPQGFK